MDDLVSTQWLADRAGARDIAIIDASAHLPDAHRDAADEFAAGHIPGARFLDLASLVDDSSPVPAALPGASQFAARMANLGIGPDQRIVIYDDSAIKTSARAWFIFRMHGVRDVAILDGGFGKWRAEGRPVESGTAARITPAPAFAAAAGPGTVRGKAEMLANLASGAEQVVDARGAARFTGEQADFRPEVASGHIPGSLNLPYGRLLRDDGTFRDLAGLREAFLQAGADFDRPIVTTCGSGVTAAVLLFALHLLGKDDVALYDGSWSEWGADPATPKAMGTAQ